MPFFGRIGPQPGSIPAMRASRFHRLRTWFWLSVGWVFLSLVMGVLLHRGPLAVVPFWIGAWFFGVWTVAVGVRVGNRS